MNISGSLIVGSTNILNAITNLQNDGGSVDTSSFVQKAGDTITGNLTVNEAVTGHDTIASNELQCDGLARLNGGLFNENTEANINSISSSNILNFVPRLTFRVNSQQNHVFE